MQQQQHMAVRGVISKTSIFHGTARFKYLVLNFPVLLMPTLSGSKKRPSAKPGGLLILEIIPTKKPPNVSGGVSGILVAYSLYDVSPTPHRARTRTSATTTPEHHERLPVTRHPLSHASFLRATLITGSPLSREEPTRQPPNRPGSSRVPDPRSGPREGGVRLLLVQSFPGDSRRFNP